MYCQHCGRELPDNARFCVCCGKPTKSLGRKSETRYIEPDSALNRVNRFAQRFVPTGLAKRFPGIMPVVFVGMYAAALLIVVITISNITGAASYDLSGTYATSDFFPVNTITFQTNGKFTAVSYGGYTETYQGKYSKNLNNRYTLRFTGGSASGGSPVTQYEASTVGQQYELAVEKVNKNTLKVQVIPKIGYYAWGGTVVYFYKR